MFCRGHIKGEILINGKGDYTIENLIIEGNGGYDLNNYESNPQGNGIYLYSDTNELGTVVIRNVTVRKVNAGGIQVKGAKNILIENCHVENCNFVAYTLVGENVIIKNCTSENTRMFMECLTLNNGLIKGCNLKATNLYNYGIRYSGEGSAIFDKVQLSGNPEIDIDAIQTEVYGFYIAPLKQIKDVSISNYKVSDIRTGIQIENDIDTLTISKMQFSQLQYTDLDIRSKVNTLIRK